MKFENEEVKEMFNDLVNKYGVTHINWGYSARNTTLTYDDLLLLEEDFKQLNSIFEED